MFVNLVNKRSGKEFLRFETRLHGKNSMKWLLSLSIQHSWFPWCLCFLIHDINHACVENCSALNVSFGPGSWDE